MNISRQYLKIVKKKCADPNCENIFEGSQFQKYCKDEKCRTARLDSQERNRKIIVDEDADNRIILKTTIIRKKLDKKAITLRCKAKKSNGGICGKTFVVNLDVRQSVYPKFCDEHVNAHKRKRYLLSGEKTCRK